MAETPDSGANHSTRTPSIEYTSGPGHLWEEDSAERVPFVPFVRVPLSLPSVSTSVSTLGVSQQTPNNL